MAVIGGIILDKICIYALVPIVEMTISIGTIAHDSFWDDEPAQRDADLHVKIISVETSEVLYTSIGQGSSFDGAENALRMALEVSLMGLAQSE